MPTFACNKKRDVQRKSGGAVYPPKTHTHTHAFDKISSMKAIISARDKRAGSEGVLIVLCNNCILHECCIMRIVIKVPEQQQQAESRVVGENLPTVRVSHKE